MLQSRIVPKSEEVLTVSGVGEGLCSTQPLRDPGCWQHHHQLPPATISSLAVARQEGRLRPKQGASPEFTLHWPESIPRALSRHEDREPWSSTFALAVVTNEHKLRGLNQYIFILLQSQKSKMSLQGEHHGASRGGFFWRAPGAPWGAGTLFLHLQSQQGNTSPL